ncbi:MAG TPA: 2-dehydropantoate 2-reductase [Chloroflexota bacterium]|nr:2-dehydropantoate 2-reductase [Chloroflexota bacterium]
MAKLAIVGGGAIGGVWAARLGASENDVSILDTSPAVVEAISRDGVVVERAAGAGSGSETVRPRTTSDPEEIGEVDVVWCFVKAQHTAAAAQLARPLVGQETIVVSQQNGWGNADVLAQTYPPEQLVVGVTYHSATVVGPGHVRHTGQGPAFVGPYVDGAALEHAERVAALLNAAGLETTATAQVKTEIWKKLILNCATLPTSALTRLTAGALGEPGPTLDLLDAIAAEAVAVANALGYDVTLDERLERIHAILRNGGAGKASMLQDVEGGRKTEIEVINAAVVNAAEGVGLGDRVPLNRAMVALVQGLERAYLKESR